ncbi:succinylglutamate desuccinylase [Halobacteriovorax sp. HLS]|uniref:succinylglutamate desuccinylase n=1 Tax=Halobacteriovorax sp. HLS TaxID=2234000 RepID=UPI000FDC3763|nr:succinylglutamate desuccinylase [Halobacteriovorax sp. HLS]
MDNFLKWTQDNEQSIEKSFVWKDTDQFQLIVHDTGVLEYKPRTVSNEQVILSCAIHGNETAPIEILSNIVQDFYYEKIKSQKHILFIFGNPRAINIEKRFCEENLNRLFAGALEGKSSNYETQRAQVLINCVESFFKEGSRKFHYDLHTAIRDSEIEKFAIFPSAMDKNVDKSQLAFLSDLGVRAVIFNDGEATTFSYHSAKLFGATSYTIELGKVRPFGENKKEDFEQTELTLRQYIDGTYKHHTDLDNIETYIITDLIDKRAESIEFSFSDTAPNFTSFDKEQLICFNNDGDFIAKEDGSKILFPNRKVRIGERAALIVVAKDLP